MQRRSRAGPAAGFTLIELVMVLVITAVLAVFALPQLVDATLWRLRAFGDDLMAQHQAALRLALQQRRPVTVAVTGSAVTWTDMVTGQTVSTLACPPSDSPCIAEGGLRTVSLNDANTGAANTGTGSALPITVSSGSYLQAYVIENDTGLIRPLP